MLRLILRTNQNNENSNGDCDFAYVEIDEELARKILARRKLFLSMQDQDPDSHVALFWERSCRYFKLDDDDDGYENGPFDQLLDVAYDDGHAVVAADDIPKVYFEDRGPDSLEQPTDCDLMVVNERGFEWKCYPKYSDGIEISTDTLPYELLNTLL